MERGRGEEGENGNKWSGDCRLWSSLEKGRRKEGKLRGVLREISLSTGHILTRLLSVPG